MIHTLGYALRGIIAAYRYSLYQRLLHTCLRTANGLLAALEEDGFLSGRLASDWTPAASWSCLTGTVQVATCWLLLYLETGEVAYRDAAYRANRYVRRTVSLTGSPGMRGGVKGSFPVSGEYGPYQYLNWAAKFFVDANMLEQAIRNTPRLFASASHRSVNGEALR